MAADHNFYGHSGHRVPFHAILESADASTNGVQVVAAAGTGFSLYLTGVILHNKDGSARTLTVVHTAGAGGKTAISAAIALAATNGIHVVNYSPALKVGSALNVGILASASGNVACEMWGYTALG